MATTTTTTTTTTESETASSTDLQLPPPTITSDTRGKHRILAELKRLDQETRFLEEELEELETADRASVVCPEYVSDYLHREAGELFVAQHRKKARCTTPSAYLWWIYCYCYPHEIDAAFEPVVQVTPKTNGPLNPSWDRWFEGAQESKGCRCWML